MPRAQRGSLSRQAHVLEWLRRRLPTPHDLAANRWLRWIGPRLHHPRLWHMSRRGIAAGMAIGVFFAFLIPIAQIPFSAAVAVLLRANVPTAVASTLVTNPVTFPPVYYAAWKVGGWMLGQPTSGDAPPTPPDAPAAADSSTQEGEGASNSVAVARDWALGVGRPLVVGLITFAVVGSVSTYLLVSFGWHARVKLKRRARVRRHLTEGD